MSILDRYIIRRFLANFVILFMLLYVFAISIDLLTQLDEFVEAAQNIVGKDASPAATFAVVVGVVVDFHGPRIFQFYAYMVGLVSVGAMGFTLAQMYRFRELTAILASGIRLHRIAAPMLAVAFALNLVQLLNQELILPELAPRLIRKHGALGRAGVDAFEIGFTTDGQGSLFQAALFDPQTETLDSPTILERDEQGRTVRRISAESAKWDGAAGGWRLTGGRSLRPQPDQEEAAMLRAEAVDLYETDLTPQVLTMRRYRQFATMLSIAQIGQLIETPGVVDSGALERFLFARFSTILINMLVLCMTLPYFLLREPASLLRNSLLCAGTAVPAMMGALIGFAMQLPGVPPAVGVFLPGLVLIPVTMFMVTLIKT